MFFIPSIDLLKEVSDLLRITRELYTIHDKIHDPKVVIYFVSGLDTEVPRM